MVTPGQGPTDPTAIPTSLLLKVSWPAGKTLTKSAVLIAGQSEPGTIVTVQGAQAIVDAKGKFSMSLKLKDGKTELRVRSHSVGDLKSESKHDVDVDTRPPGFEVDSKDLWKR